MKGTYLEPFLVKLINRLKPLNILVKKLHRRCWTGFKLRFYVKKCSLQHQIHMNQLLSITVFEKSFIMDVDDVLNTHA